MIGALFAGATLVVAATGRMLGLDLVASLAGVCTASMTGLAVSQLLPAPACSQASPAVARPFTPVACCYLTPENCYRCEVWFKNGLAHCLIVPCTVMCAAFSCSWCSSSSYSG